MSDARLSIDRIHEWIGPHRVLLPLPLGEKKPLKEGWQKTTFEETQTSEYQKELLEAFIRGGNIGVLLGNGLCAIDIDDDAFVDPFLSLNPALKDTLRSKGKDGCQIWVRIIGSYPEKICKLKTKGGTPWGEWRGGGGQSVIAGVHPESRPDRPIRYQRQVPKPAICVSFKDIRWPEDLVLPWNTKPKEGNVPEKNGTTKQTSNLQKRIEAYLAEIPSSIAGNNGDDRLFRTASVLVWSFGLNPDEALPYLRLYNERAEPPWPESRLIYKLGEALENPPARKERGYLLKEDEPGWQVSPPFAGKLAEEQEEGSSTNSTASIPLVEWGDSANSTNSTISPSQEVFYPAQSIIADYYEYAVTQSEGADCYIIGPILPTIAAILAHNVCLSWLNGVLYPNLFVMVVGPPGNLKSTSIELPEEMFRCLSEEHECSRMLPHNLSVESMFDCYYEHPYRFLVCDDATALITKWQNPHDGERLSSNYLTLYDCKRLSESFRRNRKEKSNLESQERFTGPTCTNIVFGSTFLTCQFRQNSLRNGLQRRFIYCIAENPAREIKRPSPDETIFGALVQQFSLLTRLKGKFEWTEEAGKIFDHYCETNRKEIQDCDILDEARRSRLTSARGFVAKIAMIYECATICWGFNWGKGSPNLLLGVQNLELAIRHVDACLKAAASLDTISNRGKIAEEAKRLLGHIRRDFHQKLKGECIILTKSEITSTYAHHASRIGGSKVDNIYQQQIPYLISIGLAKLLQKEGKKTTYAFRME